MRKIKFRAWDKESRKMLSSKSWCGHYDDLYFTDINQILEKMNGVNNTILMQYTGLKDKNEKEIYEGDIVRVIEEELPKDYKENIGEVIFENNSFLFSGFFGYIFKNDKNSIEVIGNIYQNPELIKK